MCPITVCPITVCLASVVAAGYEEDEALGEDDWWLTNLTDGLEDGLTPGGERPLACLV